MSAFSLNWLFSQFQNLLKASKSSNFETENAKIGPHLLTLSKQKTISVQTIPFLQMYLIPCPNLPKKKKNPNLEQKNSSVDYRYFCAHLDTQKIIFKNSVLTPELSQKCQRFLDHLKEIVFLATQGPSVNMPFIHSHLFTPYFRQDVGCRLRR